MTTSIPMPERHKRARRKRPGVHILVDILLMLVALATLGLSGWSLATLLHNSAHAPMWVAGLGVGVFDVPAITASLLVYARRNEPYKAAGSRLVMMLAMLLSAIVNGAHGMSIGGWMTAAVLFFVPITFEVVFEMRHRTLTTAIWVLFRREAFNALRQDAWNRIAPALVSEASDTVSVQRLPDTESVPPKRPAEVTNFSGRSIRPIEMATARSAAGRSIASAVHELASDGLTDEDKVMQALKDAGYTPDLYYVRKQLKRATVGQ